MPSGSPFSNNPIKRAFSSSGSSFDDGSTSPGSPPAAPANMEAIAERLFSIDHLHLILSDPIFFTRFQSFLAQYRPQLALSLKRYLDVQKALAAVKYANALAENLWPGLEATQVNESFRSRLDTTFGNLVNEALPGYITYRMTELVTEILVKEITGQTVPSMQDLVYGLAEVYCLADPALPDIPITHASKEFFRATGYDMSDVIGKNCRFLQGEKTHRTSVNRIIQALSDGQELCEIIMNYRRDGTPFLNLLLIAPLYDASHKVRYFLGAQVDINGLVHEGRGLDSFARLLAQDRVATERSSSEKEVAATPDAAMLEFGNLLNDHELKTVINGAHRQQRKDNTIAAAPLGGRQMIGMDDEEDNLGHPQFWPSPALGPNGRLPGVFQNYLLASPYPDLRIVFTSPAMRSPGLLQSRLTSRIRGPNHVRQSIKSALSYGQSFTAKISWLPNAPSPKVPLGLDGSTESSGVPTTTGTPPLLESKESQEDASQRKSEQRRVEELASKRRWIHCTPLLGPGGEVGLWMVLFVKSENVADAMGDLRFEQKNGEEF